MSRWFRIYDEILDDPKVQLLSPELFKTWVNLLAISSRNGGKLPPYRDMAFLLRVSVDDLQSRIDDLILAGLIDVMPDKRLEPHNWSRRQWKSDDSASRVRKHRAKKGETACNGDVTVTVTPPESESESDTKTLGLPSSATSARVIEDLKNLNNAFGRRNDKTRTRERVVTRAEGLGLDVAGLTDACNRHKPRNRSAYFTALCVQRLRDLLPRADEELLRSALWDADDTSYRAVMNLLMVAA